MDEAIKNRIKKIVTMKAKDIQPHPLNFRKHPPKQRQVTQASLQELGKADVIKAYEKDGKIVCLDGHLRIDLFPDLEWQVAIMDFNDEEAITYITLHDQITAMAEIDADLLKQALASATTADASIAKMFVELAKQNKIEWDEEKKDSEPKLNAAEELREQWKTEPGQLWALGDHRIICGDSTDLDAVNRLFGKEQAVCMWTDPPYGVDYTGKTADALKIENDKHSPTDLGDLLRKAYALADRFLVNGSPIYVCHPAGPLQMVFNAIFVETGWKFHETLVWVKNSIVLGHSDYHYRHEPIMYGWKGTNRFWYAGRSEDSVAEVKRPSRSEEHPTMKPVELIVKHLKNSTQLGDIVYDPFLGSGSTLIACDNLRRKCRGVELSPNYLAVVLQRWVEVTGGEPFVLDEV